MSFSKGINASPTTLTRNRTPGNISPHSGLCSTCIEGCPGLCEVGKSALRGREILYPQPYGSTTFAAEKDYPVDFSHFNIMGSAVDSEERSEDFAEQGFHSIATSTFLGKNKEVKLHLPVIIGAMGSTRVAADNWEALAAGAAQAGVAIVIGENVCGMDSGATFKNGKIVHSPHLSQRVEAFNKWHEGYGTIAVQANVEDSGFGVLEYALKELGVKSVELKWGQGAKSIGGEVKITDLKEALELSRRGYLLYPDPQDPMVQALFKKGFIKEFERHSRVGSVNDQEFLQKVGELRRLGAQLILLKTGAYRPRDLARALKLASLAKIDLVTVDGAGGGTGMSPWRMMNEWGVPTIYLASLCHKYLQILEKNNAYLPPVALAGGLSLEDHIFKALALGAPYINMVAMSRAPLAAAMVGSSVGKRLQEGKLSASYKKEFGSSMEEVFTSYSILQQKLGDSFSDFPAGAVGLYSYFDRLATGLQQLMCGARKFSLSHLERDDIGALTRDAAEITGIKHILDMDAEEAENILMSVSQRCVV